MRALKRSTFNLIACDSCYDAQLNHTENKKRNRCDVPEVVHEAVLSTIQTESENVSLKQFYTANIYIIATSMGFSTELGNIPRIYMKRK